MVAELMSLDMRLVLDELREEFSLGVSVIEDRFFLGMTWGETIEDLGLYTKALADEQESVISAIRERYPELAW